MDEIIARRLDAPPADAPRDLFDMLLAARDPDSGAAFSRREVTGLCLDDVLGNIHRLLAELRVRYVVEIPLLAADLVWETKHAPTVVGLFPDFCTTV
jgi:hypothetical protein